MIWQEHSIEDLCRGFKYGKMPPKAILADEGYPVYSGYRITGFAKEFLYESPQLVVVARGVGGTGDVKISPPNSWITNLSIVVDLDNEKADMSFMRYKLNQEALKEKLNTGAAQAQITIENLKPYRLTVPDLPTQKRIAGVLSAYDNLIENNRRRIALLEEAARLIYREWFVHFRFPNFENYQFQDRFPLGWQQATIADAAGFISRGITPKYDTEADGRVINQKCIRNQKIDLKTARKQSKRVPKEKLVKKHDVLVNSTGTGTLGRVAQLKEDLPDTTVDSHVTIVRPIETVNPTWFGCAMLDREHIIQTLGRGATNQTELSKDDLGSVELTIPDASLQLKFGKIIEPVQEKIRILAAYNKRLTGARDLLLPRLMNGEIEV